MNGIETEGEREAISSLELRKQRRARKLQEERRRRFVLKYHLPADASWEEVLQEHQRRHHFRQKVEVEVSSSPSRSAREITRREHLQKRTLQRLIDFGLPPNASPSEVARTQAELQTAIKVAKRLRIGVPFLENPPPLEKLRDMAGKNFPDLLKKAMRFETSPIEPAKIDIAKKFGVVLTPRKPKQEKILV